MLGEAIEALGLKDGWILSDTRPEQITLEGEPIHIASIAGRLLEES